jgi:hypothetical protein
MQGWIDGGVADYQAALASVYQDYGTSNLTNACAQATADYLNQPIPGFIPNACHAHEGAIQHGAHGYALASFTAYYMGLWF